jgi:lipoprotein NlpI
MRHLLLIVALICPLASHVRAADPTSTDGEPLAERIRQATRAIDQSPERPDGYALRAALYASAGNHRAAIDDYSQVIRLAPSRAEAFDERGSQHFMLGEIRESIDDFDEAIRLDPRREPGHWKRGISYYYAERYDDGRRQFEGYQRVDDNDVENAVWRYLCMARSVGVAAARDGMLKIKHDARVPMMDVYRLYSGTGTPDDVLAAARVGQPGAEALNVRLFYAHLYLGLFHEAAGDAAQARQHITEAAERHKIGHYMWNVADVHARRLRDSARQ